jgi:hypothetical protein
VGVILGGLVHIDWKSGIATDIGIEVGGGDFSLYELFLGMCMRGLPLSW